MQMKKSNLTWACMVAPGKLWSYRYISYHREIWFKSRLGKTPKMTFGVKLQFQLTQAGTLQNTVYGNFSIHGTILLQYGKQKIYNRYLQAKSSSGA